MQHSRWPPTLCVPANWSGPGHEQRSPAACLAGDLAELTGEPWDYDDSFDLVPGLQLISTPGHTPGHQALLVSFTDGRSYVCAGDAAYTLQAVVEHHVTGRPTNADEALTSLRRLTDLDAGILTAHDIDQWRDVTDAALIHSAQPVAPGRSA